MTKAPADPVALPRPNPGPEPWPGESDNLWIGIIVVGVALISILFLMIRYRRRRPKAPDKAETSAIPPARSLDQAVRAALISLFGARWATFTTEEMAKAEPLRRRLGDEAAVRLLDYLGQIDRIRFSTTQPVETDAESEAWARQFVVFAEGEAGSKAGATSISKGR